MVGIRKADGRSNVQQPTTTTTTSEGAQTPAALSPTELTQILAKVFSNAQVHGNEVPALADALKRAGPLQPDLLANLERRLADPNLKVTPETLDKLKGLGLDVTKATANLRKQNHFQQGDLKTSEKLGQTADKQVEAKVEAYRTNYLTLTGADLGTATAAIDQQA